MAILLPNEPMPSSCRGCPFWVDEYNTPDVPFCTVLMRDVETDVANERQDDCPLREVDVWNSTHGAYVLPAGLFDRLYNDADEPDNEMGYNPYMGCYDFDC